ncbi:Os08g0429225, partial [Oryza sativa Japonica Group]
MDKRARPRPPRRAGEARELDEEVELAGLERRVGVERPRAHPEAPDLLRLQDLVARVVAQRRRRRRRRPVLVRRPVHRHHPRRPPPPAGDRVAH